MPDRRRHRGRHPQDDELFAASELPALRGAVGDLAWLLSRGYVQPSALKLVGDRHGLRERQRMAVLRVTCSHEAAEARRARELAPEALGNKPLWIDGYNLLITVEAALAGGVLLLGLDGCLRDLASLHGSFKRVAETLPALEHIKAWLDRHEVGPCRFLLDQPVSNSGRLAATMRELGGEAWTVDLVPDPDAVLAQPDQVVATSDSVILDRCGPWLNLARHVVGALEPAPAVLALGL